MDPPKSQMARRDKLKNELMKRLNIDTDHDLTKYRTSRVLDIPFE
jgi:hypothetical protein